VSNCQDGCQTNSQRYDDLLSTDRVDLSNTYRVIVLVWLGAVVRSATLAFSWASCFCIVLKEQCISKPRTANNRSNPQREVVRHVDPLVARKKTVHLLPFSWLNKVLQWPGRRPPVQSWREPVLCHHPGWSLLAGMPEHARHELIKWWCLQKISYPEYFRSLLIFLLSCLLVEQRAVS